MRTPRPQSYAVADASSCLKKVSVWVDFHQRTFNLTGTTSTDTANEDHPIRTHLCSRTNH